LRPTLFRCATAIAATACLGTALAVVATSADATPSTALVVNEVYGGGGNSGATLTNDFIELTNRSSAAVSVDGWSVQYHSGGATGAWQATPLTGSIAPGAVSIHI
jgi:predicted extracellular nuclease